MLDSEFERTLNKSLNPPQPERFLTHKYHLREHFVVQFTLPESLTKYEAKRLMNMIEQLPFTK